jgi:CRISPR/Cas system endoribonuclease Cas6 (RAMP superfamily)
MYCKNSNVNLKFVKIEDNVKILIDILKNERVSETEVYSNVLNFEKYIRKNIDKRLEVFYEDRPDDNKLRKKNL